MVSLALPPVFLSPVFLSPSLTRVAARWLACRGLGLLAGLLLMAAALPLRADPADELRRALALAAAQDWAGATAAAASLDPAARDVIEWQRLRAGEGVLGEYEAFLARRPDWPGLPLLKKAGEEAVARSTTPGRVLAYFGEDKPATAAGSMALIRALQALGQAEAAQAEAVRGWTGLSFTADEQAEMLALAGAALRGVQTARLDRLLWQGEAAQARQMLDLVPAGWQALARARLGLQADAEGVNALIEAVPPDLAGDAGLAFDRVVWRMKKDRDTDAAALMLERSSSAAGLGDPEAWADRRALLARSLLRDGEPQLAYDVAARHWLPLGSDYADLEFLAGFIALRKLGNPGLALEHFQRLEKSVSTPISLTRARYWQGRALEAKGDTAGAAERFRAAARHQTAYYGLLAAEKLGLPLDEKLLSEARPTDWRQEGFTRSSVFQAAGEILAAGDRTLAKRFYLHLAESLDGVELDQLADMALSEGEPHIALLIAKAAAERGAILPRPYFPVPDMVPDEGLAVSRAFALAISRRESEFDPAARSAADARGLMQLLPGTAKLIAPKAGLPYDGARLLTDPAYNARLGSAYLHQMVEEFGPSIALVASAYNAGPGRPRRWITEFGDPRRADVDVVDWVETIPFTETRTYVMRVAESLVIYRAKLAGKVGPVRITEELRGN